MIATAAIAALILVEPNLTEPDLITPRFMVSFCPPTAVCAMKEN